MNKYQLNSYEVSSKAYEIYINSDYEIYEKDRLFEVRINGDLMADNMTIKEVERFLDSD